MTQPWTTYGQGHGNTGNNTAETLLRPDNVAGLKERWRVRFGAGGTSTPVLYDGVAYFGSWDGNVYAVDAQTGEIRWQQRLTTQLIRSTPLVTHDRVYVAAGRNLVAVARADGAKVFETELTSHPAALLDSSPKTVTGLVIIGLSSVETSYDKQPYTWQGGIVAVDAVSGSEVWRIQTTGEGPGRCVGGPGVSVWSSAAIDEELGLAYVGTGQNYAPPVSNCSDSLIAFHYARDFSGDRIAWTAQYTAGDIFAGQPESALQGPDADIGASPNLFDAGGMPLVGAGDKSGSYRVFDRRTGELVWRVDDLGIGSWRQVGGIRATAAIHDGTVFVASNILSAGSLLSGVLIGTATPGEGSNIHALDAATGAKRWMVNVPATVDGSLVVANGVLYHTVNTLGLFARDPATGRQLWNAPIPVPIGAGPSIVDGRIYLSAGYNLVSADTAAPYAKGGQMISYGLDGNATPKVWQAHVDEPAPLTQPQCESAVAMASDWPDGGKATPACASCLCECDATAAGHCDNCWLQAPCAVASCAFSANADDLYNCMGLACASKLLPTYVFEAAVAVAPCSVRCAQVCGFN